MICPCNSEITPELLEALGNARVRGLGVAANSQRPVAHLDAPEAALGVVDALPTAEARDHVQVVLVSAVGQGAPGDVAPRPRQDFSGLVRSDKIIAKRNF